MRESSKKPKPVKHRIEERPVGSLKRHPKQAEFFGDLSDVEIQQLADDMDRNGQLMSIEISPNDVLISGHQRLAAAKRLGWTHIRCWVREDLAEQGEEAIEARLLEDNQHRRQMTKLQIARCYLRLKELGRVKLSGDDQGGDLRDFFGKRFDMSGRSVDRLVQILTAPAEIQHAFEAGQLRQGQALAIVRLDPDLQQEIAQRIAEGKKPADVAKEYLTRDKPPKQPATALSKLVTTLRRVQRDVEGEVKEMRGQLADTDVAVLREARKLINRLIGKPKPNGQKGSPNKKKKKRREEVQ